MTDREEFTAYVTKYAISRGVQLVKHAVTCDFIDPTMITDTRRELVFYDDGEWFRTWPEALAKAEKMRAGKIASLHKQIARLEAMTFKEPTQ